MEKILDLLNTVCDLTTHDSRVITGYFVKPKSDIWFRGRMSRDDYDRLSDDHQDSFSLSGSVNGKPVACQQAMLGNSQETPGDRHVHCNIFPTKILVGVAAQEQSVSVTFIETSLPELRWFMHGLAVSPDVLMDDSHEKPCVARFSPLSFSIPDSDGKITFDRAFSCATRSGAVAFTTVYRVGFQCAEPVEPMTAVSKLCSVRILLCLLADDGISMPNEYQFATTSSATVSGVHLSDRLIWLNAAHRLEKREYPFRISYRDIEHQLSDIWERWSRLYRYDKPLVNLFFEVISNKSLGANRFLNLVQALEVYSRRYRNAEAFEVARNDPEYQRTRSSEPYLRHRLTDLLAYHTDVLPRSPEQIAGLSCAIARIRNYFTHFDAPEHKAPTDSSYQPYNGILHYLLLASVYKELGIPVSVIRDALAVNEELRFGTSLEKLFGGPNEADVPY